MCLFFEILIILIISFVSNIVGNKFVYTNKRIKHLF